MKISEIITESLLGEVHPFKHEKTETIMLGPIKCIVNGHIWDQIEKFPLERGHITDKDIWSILKRVPFIKPELADMEYFHQFYLRDDVTGVELGCRFTNFGKPDVRTLYAATTVYNRNLRKNAESPIIIVNPPQPKKIRIKEGGWDTTLTQGTVLHPKVVAVALQVVDRFVADFNKFAQAQGMGAIRRGRPTGSSAYHEIDSQEHPDKIYGDIDLQMIAPEIDGATFAQFTSFWNKATFDFVQAGHAPYVDTTESKPGHPIFKVGAKDYVQIDFMWHPEQLANWGATRVTPERGVKGLLTGNMYSVLGELLDISIQHAGVQLKVIDGQHVPFSKHKGTEVRTISTNPATFIYDLFAYQARELGIKRPKIDSMLKQFPGNDINDVKISKLVNGVKGFARSAELNKMFGKGDFANFSSADDFIGKFWQRYEEKAQIDIAGKKRDKAQTPEAKARAEQDRQKIQQGLDMVQGLFA